MSIWQYADWITPVDPAHRVTLGEGQTPLVRSRNIGPQAGLANLYFKLEGSNPTGSFKDRFAAAAVSHMLQTGCRECIATSSGNTGAALAAYSAAAGLKCRIAIVETAPLGKLSQMLAYGADIFRVKQFGVDPEVSTRTFKLLKTLGRRPGWMLQISGYVFCPEGMSGLETISFELAEQFAHSAREQPTANGQSTVADSPVGHVFCPAGGGGLCVAVARGFEKLVQAERISTTPAVHCVQPAGNDTIATALREGGSRAHNVDCTTHISGLQVANVVDGHLAIEACRSSGGTGHLVTDDEVWQVQKRLAREEGIFTEPAGAVAVAGALKAAAAGEIAPGASVVCLISSIGFKDVAAVDRMNADVTCPLLDVEALEAMS